MGCATQSLSGIPEVTPDTEFDGCLGNYLINMDRYGRHGFFSTRINFL